MNFWRQFVLFIFSILIANVQSYNGKDYGPFNGRYFLRLPVPHQLTNILDLLTPIHIRVETDGLRHIP